MSDKNFMSYGDAETVFTDYANKIKKAEGDEMTMAEYNALSPQEKMSGKAFFVTDAPGGGSGVPDGGTTGQALIKNSNMDGDVKWGNVATPTDIATKANESIITDAYSSSKNYAVGDYCIYNNGLYKCKSACTNVLPTNTTYWTSTKIISELGSGGDITLLDSIEGSPSGSSTAFDYSGQVGSVKTLSDLSAYKYLMLDTYVQSENIWILNSSTIIPINKVNQSSSTPTFEISITKYYKSGNNFLFANNMFQVMVYKESNTHKWKCYGYQTLTNKASSAPTYRFELYGIG